ncbi:Transcription factor [Aspergillus melleus]|uniref:Transcription factor n=1 Tax=Aspergillus melleus TaxID=138277 RepID=A0ACC3APG2_9EURO|nr:Transcription factor [Aspergillus melleus]
MSEGERMRRDSSARDSLQTSPVSKPENGAAAASSSPKKRRKVNHAAPRICSITLVQTTFANDAAPACSMRLLSTIAYDLRLGTTFLNSTPTAHAEPTKRPRSDQEPSLADDDGSSNNEFSTVMHPMPRSVDIQDAAGQQMPTHGLSSSSVNPVQHGNIPDSSGQGLANPQQLLGYNEWVGGQSQFQDMHTFHPSYMFNAHEVTNEYNLLGDFLSNSLLDDGAMFQNDDLHGIYSDPTLINSMATLGGGSNATLLRQAQPSQPAPSHQNQGEPIQQGQNTVVGNDKARETYYMTAADPSGSDPPEERMNKLLKAKYDAGLLRPFNYVKGYARLNQYMEKHLQQPSRQKILRQLDKFRPKFRERMQSLTDIELILVEMWFERSLMEYDRVFASMAIPACCWRRTGEIFRGNKEMAELIGVPIENLRDGKLAIHEIIVEDQLVSYWEKFGAIAFDNTQKAMLTSCTLKNPESNSPGYQEATRLIMDPTHLDSSQAEAIIAFAREIQARLSESNDFNDALDHDALYNLDKIVNDIHLPRAAVPHASRRQMDHEGVQLWNMCVQRTLHLNYKRDMKLACKVKSLAYLMIESVASRQGERDFRVLKMALSAAMACAETDQFDLSQRIIETIAVRLDDLEKSITQHEHPQLQSATVEYYMLRTYLSWCRGRPDIADHLFSKIPATHFDKNQGCVLNICYKIGNLALLSHEYHAAVMWLERALKAYEQLNSGSQGPDITVEEKVLLVAYDFARACLHVDNSESKELFNRAIESLRSRHGDVFAVHILQLEMLSTEESFNGQKYLQIVQSAFKTMERKQIHLNLLLCYVQKLRNSNVECYIQALKQLITETLVPFAERDLIELTFIRMVWILTDASIEVQHNLDVLQDTSQRLIKSLGPMSEEGTHSALIVMLQHAKLRLYAYEDTAYLEKKHYENLHNVANHIHASITELNPTTYQEWSLKYRVILALHFEAIIFLQRWDDAATMIEKAGPIFDAKLPSIFMDCLLRSDALVTDMARLVKVLFTPIFLP